MFCSAEVRWTERLVRAQFAPLQRSLTPQQGFFIDPTVFTDVPETSRLVREEIFGPVSVVNAFETEEEAVTHANDTEVCASHF